MRATKRVLVMLLPCAAQCLVFFEARYIFAETVKKPAVKSAAQTDFYPKKKPIDSGVSERLRAAEDKLIDVRSKTKALREKTATLELDILQIREKLIAAARLAQYHEQRIEDLESRLTELTIQKAKIRGLLKKRRNQLGRVLAALQRMARNPPEALIAQPVAPADMVRSAILLRAILPELAGEARAFGQDLADLGTARREAKLRRLELDSELGKLEGQRSVLKSLLSRKSSLRRRTVRQTSRFGERAAELIKRAKTLKDLITRLNQVRDQKKTSASGIFLPPSEPASTGKLSRSLWPLLDPMSRDPRGKLFDAGKGTLPFPVVGRVVARYGQNIASGRVHKGLTIEATSGAQVIAPFEGKAVFSGSFRGYGRLLIIEHAGGYHSLLAGMARIDANVGQWLLAGEPVGVMGNVREVKFKRKPRLQRPTLYVEFRRQGQPVDPLAWLAVRDPKVKG
ncbi:MAG: hypothetical protein CBB68_15015 [Rhodospirillaceae bacterium TMED8]|nr:hypothetical protein [Magnetovibrio sp.]OUT47739.1 MAG: hypothetical protein CBB68_15015 [Rhodospirillaceae bacterium TMED8]